MMITKKHLSRRTILRGIGATVALPLLDGMVPAFAALAKRTFRPEMMGDVGGFASGLFHLGAGRALTMSTDGVGTKTELLRERGLHRTAGWDAVALRGRHNQQNAMAAVALAAHAGAVREALAAGLASFPGVAHRLEVVAEINGVRYVNDSKATNPDAAIAALDAYPARVHLIVGGRGKGTPFDTLAAAARTAVVRAYLVGEAGPEIGEAFVHAGIAAQPAGTVAQAVAAAAVQAAAGDVVLLAPACTSFDQYASFEERGEDFRTAVRGLAERPF
jgi:UDP-N-acetylmuramoylalanine--D-glutamate ligase